jgi:hypothetical protein
LSNCHLDIERAKKRCIDLKQDKLNNLHGTLGKKVDTITGKTCKAKHQIYIYLPSMLICIKWHYTNWPVRGAWTGYFVRYPGVRMCYRQGVQMHKIIWEETVKTSLAAQSVLHSLWQWQKVKLQRSTTGFVVIDLCRIPHRLYTSLKWLNQIQIEWRIS